MLDMSPYAITLLPIISGDFVIEAVRMSAFVGTKLEVMLHVMKAKRLVMFGGSISGALLATVINAADLDFEIIVLRDLCLGGPDGGMDRCVMEAVLPKYAEVITSVEWVRRNKL